MRALLPQQQYEHCVSGFCPRRKEETPKMKATQEEEIDSLTHVFITLSMKQVDCKKKRQMRLEHLWHDNTISKISLC